MVTLRSASHGDEVVVPSERQASLRSANNSPPRLSARDKAPSTPKRRFYDDELEVPPAPKKSRYPKRDIVDPRSIRKPPAARQRLTYDNTGAGHINDTTPSTPDNGLITPSPTPPSSSAVTSRAASPEMDKTMAFMAAFAPPGNKRPKGIYGLPNEVIQNIMILLPNDKDVTRFALTAKHVGSCYTPSVRMARFKLVFDDLEVEKEDDESQTEYNARRLKAVEIQYMNSQALCGRQVLFSSWGKSAERSQQACLAALLSVITNSNANLVCDRAGIQEVIGKNQKWICRYFENRGNFGSRRGTDLLDYVHGGRKVPHKAASRGKAAVKIETAIKLCLTHLMLNPDIPQSMSGFPSSQEAVYACMLRDQLFKGRGGYEVNLTWLEHVANFFKWHFRQENGEGLLTHLFENLPKESLPRAWPGKLKNGTQKLGSKWKGSFTYIGDDAQLRALRTGTLEESAEDETSEDNEGFQDLNIFNEIAGFGELQFPDVYNRELKSMPNGPYFDNNTGEKIIPGYKDFIGLGRAKTDYHLFGRLHSLPPQAGIPGWQRVTMMKEMPDEVTGKYGPGLTQIWAYEGVVLPGGQIILGRWWSPFRGSIPVGTSYCGPFIFWQVSSAVEENNVHEALDFLRVVESKTE